VLEPPYAYFLAEFAKRLDILDLFIADCEEMDRDFHLLGQFVEIVDGDQIWGCIVDG